MEFNLKIKIKHVKIKKRFLIMATHDMDEADILNDKIIILKNG